ncbi:uncharacterized protein F5147DRAFT_699611 [Suillus discolor]|uniref:Cyclin N-terminal domain-containing protein n=1 Tax=Suillus discolor TaxID=1912936 RepID=A0A9P7JT29_9AGAM|nr:uncharacterized protein F5147DRAFT_699611 [Suillus discolor]KAG2106719.1 hypothetical protein F5147DRAFT_699611 [Suillus discolor]
MVSSPIHKASLVDPALHSPALLELLEIKLSRPVIEYVVDCVVDTVNYAMGRPSSSHRGRSVSRRPEHTKFTTFVTNVLTRAEVTLPTLLVSLVYINRAKPHLQIALEEWACERVFLGAIMIASKFSNDSTLKNVHWALCTGVFGKRDVGRIEREFLDVLDFDLSITEDDILSHHDGLSSVALPSHDFRRLADYSPSHAHSQYNRSHHVRCPDLDPSSPHSSSSGSSPQPLTPEAVPNSSFNPAVKTHHDAMELVIPPPPPPKKSYQATSTLDLLRSFPIPVPHSSSRSQPASNKPHNRYSHFPFKNPVMQVAA